MEEIFAETWQYALFKINILLVSTSDEIDSMLRRVEQNVFNEFDIVGIVLADREPEENK